MRDTQNSERLLSLIIHLSPVSTPTGVKYRLSETIRRAPLKKFPAGIRLHEGYLSQEHYSIWSREISANVKLEYLELISSLHNQLVSEINAQSLVKDYISFQEKQLFFFGCEL